MVHTRASEAVAAWLRGGTLEEPRTQEILARRLTLELGRLVHQATVSLVANGRHLPRAELIGAFQTAIGIKPEWWWESPTNSAGQLITGTKGQFALRAHPATALFPIAPDAELRELAADIRVHGLRSPIVLIKNGGEFEVLDGRNRLLACQLAGIAPTYVFWTGADPIAFVVSANLKRRHLTIDQRGPLGAEIARLYTEAAQRRGDASAPEYREPSEDPQNISGREPVAGRTAPSDAGTNGAFSYRLRRAKRAARRLGRSAAGSISVLREDPEPVSQIGTDATVVDTTRPAGEIPGGSAQSAAEEPG